MDNEILDNDELNNIEFAEKCENDKWNTYNDNLGVANDNARA